MQLDTTIVGAGITALCTAIGALYRDNRKLGDDVHRLFVLASTTQHQLDDEREKRQLLEKQYKALTHAYSTLKKQYTQLLTTHTQLQHEYHHLLSKTQQKKAE